MSDLEFMCSFYFQIDRNVEAIDALKMLITSAPEFNMRQRFLFQSVYKQVIDSIRNTLLVVTNFYDDVSLVDSECGHSTFLSTRRARLIGELLDHSKEAISYIDEILLPNTTDTEGSVFWNKLKGDFYRYVCEHADETESDTASRASQEAYENALMEANRSLPKWNQTRLSLILNYSVFKYDICKEQTMALQMLNDTMTELSSFEKEEGISPEDMKATFEMLEMINDNIHIWQLNTNNDD